jgi:hypothetical protein
MATKKQFLDSIGLNTFFTGMKGLFADQKELITLKTNTDPYIFGIDYENTLAFDINELVTNDTSAILGTGILGTMILGNS